MHSGRSIAIAVVLLLLCVSMVTCCPPTTPVPTSDLTTTLKPTATHLAALFASPTPSSTRLPTIPPTVIDRWHTECVDCQKWFKSMSDRSLQLDTEGHPHVAYGGDHLYYAWHDGVQWHYNTVDKSAGVGKSASLALDREGRPRISYYDLVNYDLKYAWHDGMAWHIEIVDSSNKVAGEGIWNTSLALDKKGHPHISYPASSSRSINLKHAWHNGTTWYIETVDTGAGGENSLALDTQNLPHIGYYDGSTIKHAWYDGSAWHVETVDGTDRHCDNITQPSLALDRQDHPHITYSTGVYPDVLVQYAWHDGAAWQVQSVGRVSTYGGYTFTSLALDGKDRPHISYSASASDRSLMYAWYDGTVWHVEPVEDLGYGTSVSLALNDSGHPSISYYSLSALKLAHHNGILWHTETVDNESEAGLNTSLALDGAGRPHISYSTGFPNFALKYAWYDKNAWHVEIVKDVGDNYGDLYGISLAVDEDERHISYSVRSPKSALEHAWYDGTEWHIETVDSTQGEEYKGYRSTSLALDREGHPHIGYVRNEPSINPDCVLQYAWHDGSAWQTETIDSASYSTIISLALDKSGRPHISYTDYNYPGDDLKHAWYDGVAWNHEVVYQGCDATFTSLALDKDDRPHISHSGYCIGSISRYAWHDGTHWHNEVVDNSPGTGGYTSLALDKEGQPHIVYSDFDTLKHAWHDGNTWHIETVDNGGDRAPLVIDEANWLHVSYYDYVNRDLRYARFIPSTP